MDSLSCKGCWSRTCKNSSTPPPTPKYTFFAAISAVLLFLVIFSPPDLRNNSSNVSENTPREEGEYIVSLASMSVEDVLVASCCRVLFKANRTNSGDQPPDMKSIIIPLRSRSAWNASISNSPSSSSLPSSPISMVVVPLGEAGELTHHVNKKLLNVTILNTVEL